MKRLPILVIFILPLVVIFCSCGSQGHYVEFGGQILLEDGSPLAGVEVEFFMPESAGIFSDGRWTVMTDESGWYQDKLYTIDQDFSITPSHPSYIFSPESYSFPGVYEDHLDLDFTAFPIN